MKAILVPTLSPQSAVRLLSRERLEPYLQVKDTTVAAGLGLYEWNALVSAGLWATLGHVEIIVRNAMHAQLALHSTAQVGDARWYARLDGVFTDAGSQDLEDAFGRLVKKLKPQSAGQIVAELNFGFWRYLLAGTYEDLWRSALRLAFPNFTGRRREVHAIMADLHNLRNRIAHHEPVHNRPVLQLRDAAVLLTGWVSAEARAWVEDQCTVPALLARRPG